MLKPLLDALRKTKDESKYRVYSPPLIELALGYVCCTARQLRDRNLLSTRVRLSRGGSTTREKFN